MSVIMTLYIQGDPAKLEQYAADNADALQSVSQKAKDEYGVIAHRFYGSGDGQILVVDEWPDEESFEKFFQAEQGSIQPIMEAVGVTAEPRYTFWRELETNDRIGWE